MRRLAIGMAVSVFVLCCLLALTGRAADGLSWFSPGQDLSASARIVPDIRGERGRSGFSFVAEFACPDGHSGAVVSKPGVFSLEVSGVPGNRLYSFRMAGVRSGYPDVREMRIEANAETDPGKVVRVAGVCTYYYEPEQANVGYRLSLYVNGEMAGSRCCDRFVPAARTQAPVVFAEGADVRRVALCARSCSAFELFPGTPRPGRGRFGSDALGDWLSAVHHRAERNMDRLADAEALAACFGKVRGLDVAAWNGAQKAVRFIETPELVVAVAARRVTGSPILGAWNRAARCALLAGDGLAWGVEYLDDDGSVRRMRSDSRLIKSTTSFRDGGFVVVSEGSGFEIRHEVRVDGGRIERKLDVRDCRGSRIRTTEFPLVNLARLPGRDTLLEPQFSGVCYENPTEGHHVDGWMYPGGMVTMQLAGYYNDNGDGVYFAAEDPSCITKSYMSDGGDGRLTLSFSSSAPRDAGASGASRFSPCGRGVLEIYRGGWFELGRVYRRFLEKSAPWYEKSIPRTDTPEWFMRNPLWILGLAQRRSRLPAVRYLRDYFEVPATFVVSVVEPPGGVGGFGPVYRIRREVQECILKLREEGIRFMTYTNPRLWYCGPGAEEYNRYSTSGKLWAIKDEAGEPHVSRFGKEDYVIPCLGDDHWLEYLRRRTRMVAGAGVSAIYHDQLPCSIPFLCHDTTHGHRAGDPSVWLSGGLWRFCDYLMGDLRREFPDLAHTGEDASEPFVSSLDGFLPWRFGKPGHVPLFQSLYSPRIQFLARGCDAHRYPGSYEGFFPKYAEQLAYGEQIGWVDYRTVSYPSPRRGFLKKLAHCRRTLADFLNSSEMEAPLSFAEPPQRFASVWGVDSRNVVTVDKVLHSTWRHVDGRRLAMFLNTTGERQRVAPIWKRGGAAFSVCRERSSRPELLSSAPERVELAPYGFEFWVVDDAKGAVAGQLAGILARAAGFMAGDRGAMLSLDPAALAKNVSVDASDGRPVAAAQAAWGILATIPAHPHCDYFRHVPEWKDGWIAAMDGGLVSYGTVDFGAGGAAGMEISLATDQKGVKVEFFDITGDVPERKFAEFRPEAGGWHEYRPCTSLLLADVHGKRDVICRVTGGICNLKNWRMVGSPSPGSAGTAGGVSSAGVFTDAPGRPDFAATRAFNGVDGMAGADAAWTLFARRRGRDLEMADGGCAYFGVVDFGSGATGVELDVAKTDGGTRIDVFDISELAPSVPLATLDASAGTRSSALRFKVEAGRSILLRARGGCCTISGWRVMQ